jgi:ABC-type glycerol-3-phosphate transport system substrate-binding protein
MTKNQRLHFGFSWRAKPQAAARISLTPGPWPLPPIFLALLLFSGCSNPDPGTKGTENEQSLAGVKLKLLVLGDPAIAAAAGQLRGEWAKQTHADFEVEQSEELDVEKIDLLKADAVICPSYLLGPLVERKLVVPLPQDPSQVLSGDFDLLRLSEATWGTRTVAVPFGSPVFVCYYRADLFDKLKRHPPRTWAEYQQLVEFFNDRKKLGDAAPPDDRPWCGAIEPLGPGWAGMVLLARAAPYAKSSGNYSTLFNIRTMEPLIASPPMERALVELAAAAKSESPEQLQMDPAGARAAFWQGRAAMALSWPTAAKSDGDAKSAPKDYENERQSIQVGFAELPGSPIVYDQSLRIFADRPSGAAPQVPLISFSGRIGAIAGRSATPQAALQLLLWLSSDSLSRQVSAASPATTLYRKSQENAAADWVEPSIPPAAAAQYAKLAQQTLAREQSLDALRIPGREEYLAALDQAVWRAVRGEQAAIESLHDAADQWRKITEEKGLEKQRQAYLHSLGLE